MKEELELWKSIQKECIDSLKRHGAIIEAITDRGQAVIRKNPAVETLAKAERKIAELEKIVGSGLDLD
jgi:phage terminase small subunit